MFLTHLHPEPVSGPMVKTLMETATPSPKGLGQLSRFQLPVMHSQEAVVVGP